MSDGSAPEAKHWCNRCFRETYQDVLLEHECSPEVPDAEAPSWVGIVRCRGCHAWAIRHRTEPVGLEPVVSFEPARRWRRIPDWLPQLQEVAPDLVGLLEEVYRAANDQQHRLLAMGVRAALDYVMLQIVGDIGSFQKKLTAMQSDGHLSSRNREMLDIVIDAGSAAAHRGYTPPTPLLEEMLAVMEGVIRDHYLTDPMLQQLKQHIPPRP